MSNINQYVHPLVAEEKKTNNYWSSGIRDNYLKRKSPFNKKFVMIDGPPFATGLPHHGHLLAGSLKDVVMRYMTMQGYDIEKKSGYDCHGVPMEMAVNKRLNINTKDDIEKIGIGKYCEECKSSVLTCAGDWQRNMNRYGRWANFEEPYTTMDFTYMKTVWSTFYDMYKQGLLMQGYRVCAYSPKLETSLSNFESSLNYITRNDQSVTVKFNIDFKLKNHEHKAHYIAVYTTTPWTLPGNMAIAINADEWYYATIDDTSVTFRMIDDNYKGNNIVIMGNVLVGIKYKQLFNMLNVTNDNMFTIYHGDFVEKGMGTGAVHVAPMFGEDDFNLSLKCKVIDEHYDVIKYNDYLTSCCEIKEEVGKFFEPNYQLTVCYQFNAKIIRYLQVSMPDNFVETKQVAHSYPHCWRTNVPLVYRAISSWFVAVTKFKDELLALNDQINWLPKNIGSGRFNDWLQNVRDWNVSRDRYWGSPIPVWVATEDNSKYIVIESPEQLELLCQLPVGSINDLHRDKIDHLTFQIGNYTYRRITSVLDCWFESGCAPAYFQEGQIDFIAEGLDQTRGWFYTLLVIGYARNKLHAFKNVMVNGLMLGNDGKKMSKSLNNYTDPMLIIDQYGADALRLYLLSLPAVQAQECKFDDEGVKEMLRLILIPLYNAVNFYTTYKKLYEETHDDFEFKDLNMPATACLTHKFNIWLMNKLADLERTIHESYKTYQLTKVVNLTRLFVDTLNNVYIKLNRQSMRNNNETNDDTIIESITILGYTLVRLSLFIAPIAPYMAEYIYRSTKYLFADLSSQSVHLCYYSDFYLTIALNESKMIKDAGLSTEIETVHETHKVIVSTIDAELRLLDYVRQLRNANNLPKSKMLKGAYYFTNDFTELSPEVIAEINVLDIKILPLTIFKNNPIKLVPKFNTKIICQTFKKDAKMVQELIMNLPEETLKKIKDGSDVTIENFTVRSDMLDWAYSLMPNGDKEIVSYMTSNGQNPINQGLIKFVGVNYILYLDSTYDEEMVIMHFVKEIARKFQRMRKCANLQPHNKITLHLHTDNDKVINILSTEKYYEMLFEVTRMPLQFNQTDLTDVLLESTYTVNIGDEEVEVKLALSTAV
jgi:isoleucyl-tRNA synthetase